MKIIYVKDQEVDIEECVATVGFFDGVHAGHRFLINELKTIAEEEKKASVVITFSVHPRKVLHSDFQPALLTTLDEKLTQLATTGIDACIVLDFTPDVATLTAQEFLSEKLDKQFHVKTLLVGHDHRFGHNRTEGFEDYCRFGNEIGMKVVKAKRYETEVNQHISSSEVRFAIKSGDIDNVRTLLTYNYSIEGRVVDGFKMGRKLGFPTANIEVVDFEKLIPGSGVYAVKVEWNHQLFNGMMNIGKRPTLEDGGTTSFEVNIFNFKEEIYHEIIRVIFIKKIRDEQKFSNLDQLIDQLHNDKKQVMGIFGIAE